MLGQTRPPPTSTTALRCSSSSIGSRWATNDSRTSYIWLRGRPWVHLSWDCWRCKRHGRHAGPPATASAQHAQHACMHAEQSPPYPLLQRRLLLPRHFPQLLAALGGQHLLNAHQLAGLGVVCVACGLAPFHLLCMHTGLLVHATFTLPRGCAPARKVGIASAASKNAPRPAGVRFRRSRQPPPAACRRAGWPAGSDRCSGRCCRLQEGSQHRAQGAGVGNGEARYPPDFHAPAIGARQTDAAPEPPSPCSCACSAACSSLSALSR